MQDEGTIEIVKRVEARRWLGGTSATYGALEKSGLLGRVTTENEVLWEDLQHYQAFGTQWPTADRPDLPPTRMVSADFIQNMPLPPDVGDEKYAGVQTWFFVWRDGVDMPDVEEALETGSGRTTTAPPGIVLKKIIPGMMLKKATKIMYEAHTNGQAVVKRCHKELAELYQERLQGEGLSVSIEKAG